MIVNTRVLSYAESSVPIKHALGYVMLCSIEVMLSSISGLMWFIIINVMLIIKMYNISDRNLIQHNMYILYNMIDT